MRLFTTRGAKIIGRKFVISLVISVGGFFVIALGLVVSDRPWPATPEMRGGIDFRKAMAVNYRDLPPTMTFKARDETHLAYRIYQSAGGPNRIIILIHGSGWHGMQFHSMARYLAARGLGTVVAPDMRGHGAKPVRRGDVNHIGQLEEDIADLIDHLSKGRSDPRIVLGGHSSGGGFVVRFAGGAYRAKADAFVLLAPFLKYNAPTTKTNSGGWARPATRRIVGLSMLNMVGITALNYLPVISFAMPQAVLAGPYGNTATSVYTYRMNAAFAPRSNYEGDLAAIDKPLLVVAGSADEAFHADRFKPVISAHTATGTYHVLPGVTHMGIVTGPEILQILKIWLTKLNRPRK